MSEAEKKQLEAKLKSMTAEELWKSLSLVTNYIIAKEKDRG